MMRMRSDKGYNYHLSADKTGGVKIYKPRLGDDEDDEDEEE
jgi:hypothetical protein